MAFKAVLAVFAVWICLAEAAELSEGVHNALQDLHDGCVKTVNVNEDVLKGCNDRAIPDDWGAKCYLECMYQNSQVKLDESKITIRGTDHDLSQELMDLVKNINQECNQITHKDKCEEAWMRANCHLQAHKDNVKFCHLMLYN